MFEKTPVKLKLHRHEVSEMVNIKIIQHDMLAHLNRKTTSFSHSVVDLNKSSGNTEEGMSLEEGELATKGTVRADILLLNFKGH